MAEDTEIRSFDPQDVSEAEWVALNDFENAIHEEQWPEDPSRSLEETRQGIQSIPAFVEVHAWGAWEAWPDRMVGMGYVLVLKADHNRHLAQFDIQVRAERRRKGLARRLLRRIAEITSDRGRTLLITNTDSMIPAGEAFMERLGAQMGLASHTNQLDLADVDAELQRSWQERASTSAKEFDVGLWDGPYPEAELASIVELNKVMNTAPRGDLDVDDFDWTPEELRQMEASLQQQEMERWTMYARHRPTGQLAGYTETFWRPQQPETLQQGNTGVFPEYRGHGLGKWLKAAMLEKVLRERPQVKRVRTGNADVNEAMLAINREMGFKPYKSIKTWQVDLENVQAYLDRQR